METTTENHLEAGNLITEVDDPSEWYRVTRTTAKSYWVAPLDMPEMEVRFGISPQRVVLRKDA